MRNSQNDDEAMTSLPPPPSPTQAAGAEARHVANVGVTVSVRSGRAETSSPSTRASCFSFLSSAFSPSSWPQGLVFMTVGFYETYRFLVSLMLPFLLFFTSFVFFADTPVILFLYWFFYRLAWILICVAGHKWEKWSLVDSVSPTSLLGDHPLRDLSVFQSFTGRSITFILVGEIIMWCNSAYGMILRVKRLWSRCMNVVTGTVGRHDEQPSLSDSLPTHDDPLPVVDRGEEERRCSGTGERNVFSEASINIAGEVTTSAAAASSRASSSHDHHHHVRQPLAPSPPRPLPSSPPLGSPSSSSPWKHNWSWIIPRESRISLGFLNALLDSLTHPDHFLGQSLQVYVLVIRWLLHLRGDDVLNPFFFGLIVTTLLIDVPVVLSLSLHAIFSRHKDWLWNVSHSSTEPIDASTREHRNHQQEFIRNKDVRRHGPPPPSPATSAGTAGAWPSTNSTTPASAEELLHRGGTTPTPPDLSSIADDGFMRLSRLRIGDPYSLGSFACRFLAMSFDMSTHVLLYVLLPIFPVFGDDQRLPMGSVAESLFGLAIEASGLSFVMTAAVSLVVFAHFVEASFSTIWDQFLRLVRARTSHARSNTGADCCHRLILFVLGVLLVVMVLVFLATSAVVISGIAEGLFFSILFVVQPYHPWWSSQMVAFLTWWPKSSMDNMEEDEGDNGDDHQPLPTSSSKRGRLSLSWSQLRNIQWRYLHTLVFRRTKPNALSLPGRLFRRHRLARHRGTSHHSLSDEEASAAEAAHRRECLRREELARQHHKTLYLGTVFFPLQHEGLGIGELTSASPSSTAVVVSPSPNDKEEMAPPSFPAHRPHPDQGSENGIDRDDEHGPSCSLAAASSSEADLNPHRPLETRLTSAADTRNKATPSTTASSVVRQHRRDDHDDDDEEGIDLVHRGSQSHAWSSSSFFSRSHPMTPEPSSGCVESLDTADDNDQPHRRRHASSSFSSVVAPQKRSVCFHDRQRWTQEEEQEENWLLMQHASTSSSIFEDREGNMLDILDQHLVVPPSVYVSGRRRPDRSPSFEGTSPLGRGPSSPGFTDQRQQHETTPAARVEALLNRSIVEGVLTWIHNTRSQLLCGVIGVILLSAITRKIVVIILVIERFLKRQSYAEAKAAAAAASSMPGRMPPLPPPGPHRPAAPPSDPHIPDPAWFTPLAAVLMVSAVLSFFLLLIVFIRTWREWVAMLKLSTVVASTDRSLAAVSAQTIFDEFLAPSDEQWLVDAVPQDALPRDVVTGHLGPWIAPATSRDVVDNQRAPLPHGDETLMTRLRVSLL